MFWDDEVQKFYMLQREFGKEMGVPMPIWEMLSPAEQTYWSEAYDDAHSVDREGRMGYSDERH